MEQLMVGVGQEVITPVLGTMLMGYTPMRPALGVHDDLHVTAFALAYSQVQALYLSLDLCNMYYPEAEIRAQISMACGVPAEHIIMSCTHTHSGPATHQDDQSPNYMNDIFIPAAIKASVDAVKNKKPAEMGIGQTYSEVAVNRRKIKEDGTVILGQNPHGSWDPTMTVISFREPDGTPIGNIIQYGCHNTASGRNDDVTRDWCGVAVDRLQKQSGGITAFINGCGGDCGPRLPNGWSTGNLEMAMELGGKAAIDAIRAWKSIKMWQNVPLKVLVGEVEMPLQDIGTEEQIMEQAAALGDPETLTGTMRSSYERLMDRVEYLQEGNGLLFARAAQYLKGEALAVHQSIAVLIFFGEQAIQNGIGFRESFFCRAGDDIGVGIVQILIGGENQARRHGLAAAAQDVLDHFILVDSQRDGPAEVDVG